jgi:hypothetical protein
VNRDMIHSYGTDFLLASHGLDDAKAGQGCEHVRVTRREYDSEFQSLAL